MDPVSRGLIPKILLRIGRKVRDQLYITYLRLRLKPLLIRKNSSDLDVFRQVFIKHEYDVAVVGEPTLIIDAGANVGYASLYFHDKYPQADIFAVEPEQSNYTVLTKNIAGRKNIRAVNAGLWSTTGRLKVVDVGEGNWSFQTHSTSDTEGSVKTITLDELLKISGHDEIDILKIDIEGAEKEIFSKNYDEWLSKTKTIIIELHDDIEPDASKTFYEATNQYGFTKTSKGENIVLKRN